MVALEESLNWVLTHWYLFAIIGLVMILYKWYEELKRFKSQFTHWTKDRLDNKIKTEAAINPPQKGHVWLLKEVGVGSLIMKLKRIGRITSFKEIPHNPNTEVTLTASTLLLPLLHIPLGRKKIFRFNIEDVIFNDKKKAIIVPYEYYWSEHPSGELILTAPKAHENWKVSDKEIDRDLKTLAIDGFASQMSSFSSVKPTWGHEDNVMAKETENKFGFLDKFGRKPPKEESGD